MNEGEQLRAMAHESGLIDHSPGVPTDSEVQRMVAKARSLAGRGARNPGRRWQVAVAATVVAGAVAVALALVPGHLATPAFARERAVQALMFHVDGRVTHMELTLKMKERGPGRDACADVNERWSTWIDADGKRIREQNVSVADGSLEQLSVRLSHRVVTLLTGRQYKKPMLVDSGDNGPVETMFDGEARYMRGAIADGRAFQGH